MSAVEDLASRLRTRSLIREDEFGDQYRIQLMRRESILTDFLKSSYEVARRLAEHVTNNFDITMRIPQSCVDETKFYGSYSDLKHPLHKIIIDIPLIESRSGLSLRRRQEWSVRIIGRNEKVRSGKNSDQNICDDGYSVAEVRLRFPKSDIVASASRDEWLPAQTLKLPANLLVTNMIEEIAKRPARELPAERLRHRDPQ